MTLPRIARWALGVVLALVATFLLFSGNETITVTAVFDDVGDLVTRSHVRAGDVPIGTVTKIELTTDGQRALVTMEVEPDTGLPAADQIVAVLSRTSLLGERFVDLRAPEDGGTGALADGDQVAMALTTSDLEQLVSTGDALLSISLIGNVALSIQSSAEALGGQGQSLTTLTDRLRDVIGQYNAESGDLLRVIDAFESFTATLAPDAELNAEGFSILDETTRVLQRQDERLLDTLNELRRLAEVGARILSDNADEFDNSFRRLRLLLEQLNRNESNVQDLITWVRRHNAHVSNGVFTFNDGTQFIEHAQVWLDFIICGLPGFSVEGDPAADCTPPELPGPGGPAQQYPTRPECWDAASDGANYEPIEPGEGHDYPECREDVEGHR
ncbi:MAG: MlaD family protein [Nitriliruptorales bacterium]|nr:MlaD family protein [Nitriliruptorales bacterium]